MNFTRLLQHKNAYSRMLLIFLACMLPFTLMRLALYLLYREDFHSLGVLQVLESFAVGLRFDISMVAMVVGFPAMPPRPRMASSNNPIRMLTSRSQIRSGAAFFSNSLPQGYLALNGAFAIARAINDSAPPPKVFMPQDEAIALTHDYLAGKGAPYYNRNFPLYQQARTSTHTSRPNVVVIMLESWGAMHIDALRKQMNLPPLGVTPNFDSLAQKGRLYTHFYANGQRSIQGAAAVLAGMPTLPGLPFLGEGLEQNQQSFLGELALSQGYETFFLQSSDRSSLRFDAIAARAGFSTYLANQDIPELHEHKKAASTWGTWDHNTFQEASKRFATAHKPFLGYIFTSTSHVPWLIPDSRWKKYGSDSDMGKALNALYYADWALGEFIASAKQAGYYDNTIFVLLADHTSEFVENVEQAPNLFHIPLLIVGPGIKNGIDERIGSQFDIMPTVMDAAGWSSAYAGLGRSLFDNTRLDERAALCVRDTAITWITPKGWLSHDLTRRVGNSTNLSDQELDAMEKNLLAVYQASSRLQLDNQIAPPVTLP